MTRRSLIIGVIVVGAVAALSFLAGWGLSTDEPTRATPRPTSTVAGELTNTGPPITAGPGQMEVRLPDGRYVVGDVVPWPPPPGTPGWVAPTRPIPTSAP